MSRTGLVVASTPSLLAMAPEMITQILRLNLQEIELHPFVFCQI